MNRPKGLRHLRTLRTLSHHARPSTRAQTATMIARLEHERARTEREHETWQLKAEKTAEQLRQIDAQLATLHHQLAAFKQQAAPAERNDALVLKY